MTPYDFLKKVKKIEEKYRGDTEAMHDALDMAMEDMTTMIGLPSRFPSLLMSAA